MTLKIQICLISSYCSYLCQFSICQFSICQFLEKKVSFQYVLFDNNFELLLNPLGGNFTTQLTSINRVIWYLMKVPSNILYLMIEETTICYSLTPNFLIDFRIINQLFDSINKLLVHRIFLLNKVNYWVMGKLQVKLRVFEKWIDKCI